MNKKFILRIFACVFAVVIGIGCFSGCGMDISEIFGKLSSSQDKSQSSQEESDKKYFQRIVNYEKSQRIVNCDDVENGDKPLQTSYYDDCGYYYYVYYLGTIEDFIIHNYYSFQYTADRQVLKDFSVTISQATSEQIKTSYTNTINRSVSANVSVSLSRSIGAKVGIDELSLSSTVSAACSATWGANLTETQSNSYENITQQSNETVRKFELDYGMCVDDQYYCYATCTDVDVYVAVMYQPSNGKAEYNYFTSISPSSVISEKVFVSDKNDFLDLKGQFNKTFASAQFNFSDKPNDHRGNLLEVSENYSKSGEYKVTPLGKKKVHVQLITDNGDGRTTAQKYADYGYKRVKINISLYYSKEKEGRMRLTISPTESGAGAYMANGYTEEEILEGGPGTKNYAVEVPMDDWLYRGDIWLNFRNQHMIWSYTISLIQIKVTYYY